MRLAPLPILALFTSPDRCVVGIVAIKSFVVHILTCCNVRSRRSDFKITHYSGFKSNYEIHVRHDAPSRLLGGVTRALAFTPACSRRTPEWLFDLFVVSCKVRVRPSCTIRTFEQKEASVLCCELRLHGREHNIKRRLIEHHERQQHCIDCVKAKRDTVEGLDSLKA